MATSLIASDGAPDEAKVSRPVRSGGKAGDNVKRLPIAIVEPARFCGLEGDAPCQASDRILHDSYRDWLRYHADTGGEQLIFSE